MPDAAALRGAFGKPFAEQQAFFRQKLSLPSERWDDILKDQHDAGFIVAGAQKADLVADLRAAVQRAMDAGKSIGWFRAEFDSIVKRRGWTGWTGQGTEAGEAWRTRVIYTTNLRTSHHAGRWAQMTDPDVMAARPYWRYVHTTVEHPRLNHKAWHNTVLPAADPWFNTHFTPNGWGCKCRVETLNERGLARLGKTGPDKAPDDGTYSYTVPGTDQVVQLPKGISYGWDYAPGRSAAQAALAARAQRLETVEAAVARLNVQQLVGSRAFGRFFAGEIKGEFPVAALSAADRAVLGAESSVVLLSQESLTAHLTKHPEITLEDYRRIQDILDRGEVYKQGDERLVYITIGGVAYRAALKRTRDGKKNYFLTLFRDSKRLPPSGAVKVR